MPATIEFGAAVANFPGVKGEPGPGTTLRIAFGAIQAKRDDQPNWISLLTVAELTGADGKSQELRTVGTALQARPTGGTWTTLFDLNTLRPDDGAPGKSVELQVSGTNLQARQTGGTFTTIFDLSRLKGEAGAGTEMRVFGGFVQWRPIGEANWVNLVAVSALVGPAGANPDLRVQGTALQARQGGSDSWTTIYDLSSLRGERGETGSNGADARDGGLYPLDRPGDSLWYFTRETSVRPPEDYQDLPDNQVVVTGEGAAFRFTGAGLITTRQFFVVEPGSIYRAHLAWGRNSAPRDPSGDTLRFGLLLYGADKASIGSITLKDWQSIFPGERQSFDALVARAASEFAQVTVLAKLARYVRPYVETFGGAQTTDIESIAFDRNDLGGLRAEAAGLRAEAAAGRAADQVPLAVAQVGLATAQVPLAAAQATLSGSWAAQAALSAAEAASTAAVIGLEAYDFSLDDDNTDPDDWSV